LSSNANAATAVKSPIANANDSVLAWHMPVSSPTDDDSQQIITPATGTASISTIPANLAIKPEYQNLVGKDTSLIASYQAQIGSDILPTYQKFVSEMQAMPAGIYSQAQIISYQNVIDALSAQYTNNDIMLDPTVLAAFVKVTSGNSQESVSAALPTYVQAVEQAVSLKKSGRALPSVIDAPLGYDDGILIVDNPDKSQNPESDDNYVTPDFSQISRINNDIIDSPYSNLSDIRSNHSDSDVPTVRIIDNRKNSESIATEIKPQAAGNYGIQTPLTATPGPSGSVLPQTGEADQKATVSLGLISLVASAAFAFRRRQEA
jgi:LPXTG-motif cell wall-anchored protein